MLITFVVCVEVWVICDSEDSGLVRAMTRHGTTGGDLLGRLGRM